MRTALLCAASAVALSIACSTERPATATRSADGEVAVALSSGAAPAVRLVVDTAGAEVRYRVRERLVGKDLDNDVVGVTRAISGQIALAHSG